ncbi:hypothetical protein ATN81_28000 [Agrobacterium pusense]|uniref:hypothetical protein n=2 Tax=Agrobacterium TaxID=357 RepID=UPI000926A674|nr:hypothetical protein [Agrobacterium pusense]OJH51604.1 hypothetical protein ATN81_28000 [Agrobacterium pusense]
MKPARNSPATRIFQKPLSRLDRKFLFMLRDVAGGTMPLIRIYDRDRAKACAEAGYCRIEEQKGGQDRVYLKDSGRRYLDVIVRAD